jgi:hypothetical protein
MQKEYDVLIKNGTWKLVDPLFGTKPLGCRWVYKNKYKSNGSLDKHKARLVVKGFAQKEGIDFEETFAHTTKWATIHALLSLAVLQPKLATFVEVLLGISTTRQTHHCHLSIVSPSL